MPRPSFRPLGPASKVALSLAVGALLSIASLGPALAGGGWNDAGIAWMPYAKGLEAAKAQGKPICLVFYTDWCPHCVAYSAVFHDPKVVGKAKQFVMIRLNQDKHPKISERYALDGEYVPRTYFLSSKGKLDPDIHAVRDRFLYFFDEKNPASILAGMDAAIKKLSPAGSAKPEVPSAR